MTGHNLGVTEYMNYIQHLKFQMPFLHPQKYLGSSIDGTFTENPYKCCACRDENHWNECRER